MTGFGTRLNLDKDFAVLNQKYPFSLTRKHIKFKRLTSSTEEIVLEKFLFAS